LKRIWLVFVFVLGFGLTNTNSWSQAVAGRADPKNPQVEVSYYKVPPGRQDEWLALYHKYHYPIMKYSIEKGLVVSEQLFTRQQHELSPDWDFMIIIVTPPPSKAKHDDKTRGEVIRQLFPDVEDYVRGEKQRWALTLLHWDDTLLELDPSKAMSLYEPQ